jgi:hypothetical protein
MADHSLQKGRFRRTLKALRLLYKLPKVDSEELSADSECMICQTPYYTVVDRDSEHAVRLSCNRKVPSVKEFMEHISASYILMSKC